MNKVFCYIHCKRILGRKNDENAKLRLYYYLGYYLLPSLILGHVDFFGNLTGDSIAFIYPDLKHVLLGTFTKGQLSLGQLCYVANIRFVKADFPKLTYTPTGQV